MKKPHINLNIRGTHTSKKDTDPVDLLFSAQETIEQYPENWIHIYTDGSAFKGTVNAGYGSRIQYPDQTSEELFDSCGAQRSNYEAEAEAIDASLLNISKHFRDRTKTPNNIIIFSDAKSVLQSLESGKIDNTSVKSLTKTIDTFITDHSVDITLQWIPGHANIPGNERADKLAKKGASCPQTDVPTSLETAKQIIRCNKKEEWMNAWAESTTGRAIFTHMTTPTPKDNINSLKRSEQTTIFRLRSQHLPLNSHLKRIGVKADSSCPLCPCPDETVAHNLFQCPALKDLRSLYLPRNPSLENTLYTNVKQLRNTHIFFVMGRRARAQMMLDQ